MDTNMNRPTLSNAARPLIRTGDSRIGGFLLEAGKLTPDDAERVLSLQSELGIRFGEAARRLGLVTDSDIEQVLAHQFDYPYLPQGPGQCSPHLVAAHAPFSAPVEALRAVRSQLTLRWFGRGRKSLVVLGIDGGDGSSLFAANLAVVFSQLGEHTLLVDANLRKPDQHRIFGLKEGPGLSDLLAGRAELEVIDQIEALPGLHVLQAGTMPPNPHELLSRIAFGNLQALLEARFDVVLYDVASFALGSDALAVAARAGGVLLLARCNRTSLVELDAAGAQLAGGGAQIVGSVMLEF
jgi:protein-tyrosine kinase